MESPLQVQRLECFNCQKLGSLMLDSNSKALVAKDSQGEIDWTKEFDDESCPLAMVSLAKKQIMQKKTQFALALMAKALPILLTQRHPHQKKGLLSIGTVLTRKTKVIQSSTIHKSTACHISQDVFSTSTEEELKDHANKDSGSMESYTETITNSLDFKELQREVYVALLMIPKICDKKHNVLFTDTECLILSLEFKIVDIVKNPVFHSKTKHIQIRHHFIRDCYDQRLINVVKWIQQFWNTAKVRMINEVAHIKAKMALTVLIISSFLKIKATLSKKKKLKKAHKQKSSSFKQGRKKVSDGSTGLNEVDVNSGDSQMMDVDNTISAEVHEGTAQVNEGTAQVNEGTAQVHEGTAQVNEGTAQVNEGTAQVHEGTAEVNEGTAEVNESTAGANLSTEPSMKEVEDEAGPSTFQDESDEFIQDDTLIADTANDEEVARKVAAEWEKEEERKRNDEKVARKVAAEWEEEEERKRLAGLERLQYNTRCFQVIDDVNKSAMYLLYCTCLLEIVNV
ncbi:hypothetical protein Tco_0242805, partial [Tanacetum coccineum]